MNWYRNLAISFSCFPCFLVTHYSVTDPYFYVALEKDFACIHFVQRHNSKSMKFLQEKENNRGC